jgi:hypothetical protein
MSGIGPEAEVDEHALLGFEPRNLHQEGGDPGEARDGSPCAGGVRNTPYPEERLRAALSQQDKDEFISKADDDVERATVHRAQRP